MDLEVRNDGVAVDDKPSENVELDVEEERLLPGLYEGLLGMARDETKEIPVHLPDDYRRSELAGQDVVFAVTVKEIKEHQLPPLDDELAKTAGVGDTLAELRARLKERLQAAAERDATYAQQKAVLEALVERSELDVPEVLVEEEIDREIRNLAVNLGQQGIDLQRLVESGGADTERLRQERREPARDRVRQELVLDALAEQQGLDPSEGHVLADARRSLEGSEDADRLIASERVQAYVRERLRLQWALLWLAAHARGEDWTAPAPGEEAAGLPETAAAQEITELPPEPKEPPPPAREDGMVDI
jgi:trigger factor